MLREGLRRRRRYSSSSNSSVSSRSRSRSRENHSKRRNHRRSRSYHRSKRVSRSRSRSPSHYRRTRYYGTRENPYKSRVVGVFGLSAGSNEAKLMDVFAPFGAIEHVSIIHDAKTGNSRGFGFIYYSQVDHATRARNECNGMTLDGKRIRVDYSITKRAHTPTPGVYMGKAPSRSPRRHRSRSTRRHHRSRRDHSDQDSSRHSRSRSR